MSLVNFDQLSQQELVLNYLIEVRGRGLFFPYSDLDLVNQWIKLCPDFDELLVILGDTAPSYFQSTDQGKVTKSRNLKGFHKIVMKKMSERARLGMRQMERSRGERHGSD